MIYLERYLTSLLYRKYHCLTALLGVSRDPMLLNLMRNNRGVFLENALTTKTSTDLTE
jgi:hypothetical protein